MSRHCSREKWREDPTLNVPCEWNENLITIDRPTMLQTRTQHTQTQPPSHTYTHTLTHMYEVISNHDETYHVRL